MHKSLISFTNSYSVCILSSNLTVSESYDKKYKAAPATIIVAPAIIKYLWVEFVDIISLIYGFN